jgi:hypothetical protein
MTDLTLGQAARLCGRGKSTLARAIKAGRLSASRRDDGGYLINAAELVFPLNNPATVAATGDVVYHATVLETEIAGLRQVSELLRRELDDVRQDRDRWRTQAERLALTDATARRPWWRRLAG